LKLQPGIVIKCLSSVCLVAVILSCERRETENPIPEQSQKQIKSIMETIHDPLELDGVVDYRSEISKNSFITQTAFDPRGNLLSKDQFNSSGNREWRTIWKYDGQGNPIESATYHFKSAISKRVNKYNSANKLIESNAFDETGKNVEREIARSDSTGHAMRVVYSFEKGMLVKTSESFYDENDKNVEIYYFTDERLIGKEINRFDSRGNRIETIIQYPVKKEERITHYKYDSLNNNIETIVLNGSLMIESKTMVRYDAQHNVVELVSYGIKGNVKERIRHHYDYDGEGNWIKDITFINKKPVSVRIRKIEYY
jgi:hypothetical protein